MRGLRRFGRAGASILGTLLLSGTAAAAGNGSSAGDTAWVLVSAALVTFMIPGVALFYGGMVRKKNVLSTLTMVLASTAVVGVQWVLVGYSLAFGPDVAGLVGGLEHVGLVGLSGEISGSIPHLLFAAFQGTFAAVTVALIVGGIVGRMKFGAWLAFALLWTTLVYDPIAHWVWGGGWLTGYGALDFAGGTVVHVNSGASALALVLVLGARKGFGEVSMEPHDVPMTVLGAAMLWFGWFGFNAGSALAADGGAAVAFISTNTAAAAGAVTWMLMSWRRRAPSALGLATGAVSGLVAITPAAGYVSPLSAIPIGGVAGVLCYYALLYMKERVDESLDVWAVHGVGGIWGALATGVFAQFGATGLLFGNPGQLYAQAIELAATTAYAFLATLVIAYAVDAAIGLRVEEKEEDVGLDLSQHGEKAYSGGV